MDGLIILQKCGKLDQQIELLKQKLRMIGQGEAFNGKPTKTARSHGKKFQVTVKQETSRILVCTYIIHSRLSRPFLSLTFTVLTCKWCLQGNLGWAYMQQANYTAAAAVYSKAQETDPDSNKACNLCLCLIKQERYIEARLVLGRVLEGNLPGSDDPKSRSRAEELMKEIEAFESMPSDASPALDLVCLEDVFIGSLDQLMSHWNPPVRSRRLPIFEEIISYRDQLAC